jgi:hypothetical protein
MVTGIGCEIFAVDGIHEKRVGSVPKDPGIVIGSFRCNLLLIYELLTIMWAIKVILFPEMYLLVRDGIWH